MEVTPRIEILKEKKLIGKHLHMSFSGNRTGELWSSFMPRRNEIVNRISDQLISIQIYNTSHFTSFNPEDEFEKWAAVEVSGFENLPAGMDGYTIPGGLYAVFEYKGSSTDNSIYMYIFGTWMPNSDYIPDNRPHFEVLGKKYKNNDPESEEEIWIPIRYKESDDEQI